MPKQKIILRGIPASPGRVKGRVKVINSVKEMDKMEEGDILVASFTNPQYTPAILKASAIITDVGGVLSHAAIVSRESGIPCIVDTGKATEKLKDNMEVTIDGGKGIIYQEN